MSKLAHSHTSYGADISISTRASSMRASQLVSHSVRGMAIPTERAAENRMAARWRGVQLQVAGSCFSEEVAASEEDQASEVAASEEDQALRAPVSGVASLGFIDVNFYAYFWSENLKSTPQTCNGVNANSFWLKRSRDVPRQIHTADCDSHHAALHRPTYGIHDSTCVLCACTLTRSAIAQADSHTRPFTGPRHQRHDSL